MPALAKVNAACPFAGTRKSKVLPPVLGGDPGHALGEHDATSCATPL